MSTQVAMRERWSLVTLRWLMVGGALLALVRALIVPALSPRLIELTDTRGSAAFVNPASIAYVRSYGQGAAIGLVGYRGELEVRELPETIAARAKGAKLLP